MSVGIDNASVEQGQEKFSVPQARCEDIQDDQPMSQGFPSDEPTEADPNLSLPIVFHILSIQVTKSLHQSKVQDDVVNFFRQLTFHSVDVKGLWARFGIILEHGLDNVMAACNLQCDGKNTIAQTKHKYAWKLFTYLFGSFCSILWVGVVVFFICWKPLGNSLSLTNLALAILLLLVILIQACFSALDWSTRKVMNSILQLLPSECVVVREGQTSRIPAAELVIGDIVILSVGNKVPADI